MRRWVGLLLVVVLALAALVAWFPAAWAWKVAAAHVPQARLGAVQGTIWNGSARNVTLSGQPLGTLHWTLSRAALLGRLRLALQVDGPLARGYGHFARDAQGRLVGRDVHVDVDVGRLPLSLGTPALRPGGRARVDVDHVLMRDGWPERLQGRVRWRDATLADRAGAVPVGEFEAVLSDRAGTALDAVGHDVGSGPLQARVRLQASMLGWRLDARLLPRTDSPRLRSVLAHLGPLAADGSVHVQRQGGLVMGAKP